MVAVVAQARPGGVMEVISDTCMRTQEHTRKAAMSIRKLMSVAGGLVLSLGAMPAASLHAQAKDDVKADSKWVHEVAADNLLEVNLGKMAERKAANPAVKQFGERMVTDHGKANQDLLSLASSHGLPFKPELGRRHEQKVDRLEKVQGKEFDRAYIRSMI